MVTVIATNRLMDDPHGRLAFFRTDLRGEPRGAVRISASRFAMASRLNFVASTEDESEQKKALRNPHRAIRIDYTMN